MSSLDLTTQRAQAFSASDKRWDGHSEIGNPLKKTTKEWKSPLASAKPMS